MSKWQEYRQWLANESEEAEFWFIDTWVEDEPEWTCARKMGTGIWLSHGGLMLKQFALSRIESNLRKIEGEESLLVVEEPVKDLSYYWNLFKKWCGI